MKKRVIAIVLFLFCGLILSGSVFNSKEEFLESPVRNIVLEDKKLDLSYYENKYDIYNEENTCFEITESYQPSNIALGKNSESSELEVQFYAFVNKEKQYFIFSYKGIIDENVVISSKVIINLMNLLSCF